MEGKMSYFNKPTDEQIRERAYEIYLQRGSAPGQEVEDWLAAEQELTGLAGEETSWIGTERVAEQELGVSDLQSEDLRTAKKRTASA
jgi:hypothetical protein